MPVETAQMLCTALAPFIDVPYKPAFRHHPCTQWCAASTANFRWLCLHGLSLCHEYTRRYGRRHKSQDVIQYCFHHIHYLPDGPLTAFAQAMPDQYKSDDAVTAYRQYYIGEKTRIAQWKKTGNPPDWFSQTISNFPTA